MALEETPLGILLGNLLKNYVGVFSNALNHLSISRYHYILVLIDENPGINQQGLGDVLGTDKVSIARTLDYLATNGCIERTQNPNDRREHLLSLTPKAKEMLPDVRGAVKKANEVAFNGFDPGEIAQICALLKQMSCNLHNLPKDTFHIHLSKEQ